MGKITVTPEKELEVVAIDIDRLFTKNGSAKALADYKNGVTTRPWAGRVVEVQNPQGSLIWIPGIRPESLE